MIRNTLRDHLLHGSWLRGFAAALALLAIPAAAGADPFILYGQVFQIAPDSAADESIAAAALPTGRPMPFVRLQAVDAVTGASRGAEAFAGATGNFTLHLEAPAGSSAAIRISRVIDGEVERIPDARDDINTFALTSPAAGVAVKVASDETLLLGPGSNISAPSVGIVFTQVGLVEIPYISQDLTRPDKQRIGLADLSGDLTRAAEQNLPSAASAASSNAVFKDAPFGGLLHVFGAFGRVVPPCTGTIDWYRVKFRPVSFDAAGNPVYHDAEFGADLLRKMRFEIDYSPFRARAFLETIGPFDGDDVTSGSTVSIDKLYRVNPLPTSPGQTVVYSMADQRYGWYTGSRSGLYEISLEYFQRLPGGSDTHPRVVRIPDSCFSGVLPPEDAARFALHKLLVLLDNTGLASGMDGLFVRTGGGGPRSFNYLEPGHRCDIIDLPAPDDTIEIDFKAWHNAGYLRSYSLSAVSNAGDDIAFASDNYDNHSGCGPLWRGGTAVCPTIAPPVAAPPAGVPVITATNMSPFPRCAYIFDLVVRRRTQNGYGYVPGAHHRQTYYVNPLP